MGRREPYNPLLKSYPDSEQIVSVKLDADFVDRRGNYVYFIESGRGGPIKIGMGWKPTLRLKTFQAGNPRKLRLLAVIEDNNFVWEQRFHEAFTNHRIRGEWFQPSGELVNLAGWLQERAVP